MNELTLTGDKPTMTSIQLMDIVNKSRIADGQKPHEPRKFLWKVEDEIDNLSGKKFRLNNNQTQTAYYDLTHEQCMLVGMRESKAVRRNVLNKLKEMEAKPAFVIPQTLSEALRLAADLSDKVEEQKLLLEQQAPAVAFVDQYVEAKATKGLREVAKVLGVKERAFIAELEVRKILYRQPSDRRLVPYAQFIADGYFEVKTGVTNDMPFIQTKFTPKGIAWIAEKLGLTA